MLQYIENYNNGYYILESNGEKQDLNITSLRKFRLSQRSRGQHALKKSTYYINIKCDSDHIEYLQRSSSSELNHQLIEVARKQLRQFKTKKKGLIPYFSVYTIISQDYLGLKEFVTNEIMCIKAQSAKSIEAIRTSIVMPT